MTKNLPLEERIPAGRLILEKLCPEDCDFILSLVNSEGWIENIGNRNIHSKNDAITYINKILGTENLFYWVVRLKDANTPVGIISFLKRNFLENFDIGFAFLPYFRNNGYAYEAANAVLLMTSQLPGFDTVQAVTLPSNKNSIMLLAKLGFRFQKETEIENQKLHIYTNAPLSIRV